MSYLPTAQLVTEIKKADTTPTSGMVTSSPIPVLVDHRLLIAVFHASAGYDPEARAMVLSPPERVTYFDPSTGAQVQEDTMVGGRRSVPSRSTCLDPSTPSSARSSSICTTCSCPPSRTVGRLLILRCKPPRGRTRRCSRASRGLTDSSGAPHDVVLITGDVGSGKTSFLDAILEAKEDIGAYGPRRAPASHVRPGAHTARVEVRWRLSPDERARAGITETEITTVSVFGEDAPALSAHPEGLRTLLAEYTRDPERGKVEYFHAERALPPSGGARAASGDVSPVMEARTRLALSLDKYRSLRGYVIDAILNDGLSLSEAVRERGIAMRRAESDAQTRLREVLRPLVRDKAFDGIDRPESGYRVRFRCRDGAIVDLDELSASERQAVLFGLTFARSGVHRSLVLIDTPELHQHPSRHADFFAALGALGRDNQIIAATTSPELLSSVRPEQVIDLSRARA